MCEVGNDVNIESMSCSPKAVGHKNYTKYYFFTSLDEHTAELSA